MSTDDEKTEDLTEERDRICRELCPDLYEDETFSELMDYIRLRSNGGD